MAQLRGRTEKQRLSQKKRRSAAAAEFNGLLRQVLQ